MSVVKYMVVERKKSKRTECMVAVICGSRLLLLVVAIKMG